MESSFLELRCKEVINVVDGKRLGHIVDVLFDLQSGKVLGFVVPGNNKNFWNVFKGGTEIFIPFCQVCKIGDDAILVELYGGSNRSPNGTIIYTTDENKNNN